MNRYVAGRLLTNRAILGGLITTLVGVCVVWESLNYQLGNLMRMGPGFFPAALGVLLIVLGGLLLLAGRRSRTEDYAAPQFRSALAVLGALALFGLVLSRFGLGPAMFALVIVGSSANSQLRPFEIVILALAVATVTSALFVWGLGLPVKILTW